MKLLKAIYLPLTLILVLSISICSLQLYKKELEKRANYVLKVVDTSAKDEQITILNTPKYNLEESKPMEENKLHNKEIHSDIEILTDLENNMSFLNELFEEVD